MNLESLKRLETNLSEVYNNERHLTDAANGVFMSALRNNVDIDTLMDSIEDGTAFLTEDFFRATKGNLADFVKEEFQTLIQPLVNITAGGNGGMASIGRGEFFIAFMSNFSAIISKSGRGDIEYNGQYEEVKHNGGKINVDDKAGREVHATFMKLLEQQNIKLKKKDYLPNRRSDFKLYTEQERSILNGLYWNATVGEMVGALTYDQWALKCVERAAQKVLDKSDSLLIIDNDNNFVRFTESSEVVEYYKDNIEEVAFELRNKQANPVAIYMNMV